MSALQTLRGQIVASNVVAASSSGDLVVSGKVQGSTLAGDGSAGVSVTATGGTTAVTLAARAGIVLSALDFGVQVGTTTDQTAKLQALITAVSNAGGGIALLPAGTIYLRGDTSTGLYLANKVRLVGAGMAATTLLWDDTLGTGAHPAINVTNVTDATIEDLGIKGSRVAPYSAASQSHLIYGTGATRLSLRRVRLENSSYMGLALNYCDTVDVVDSRVYHTGADGLAIWNTPNVLVRSNLIVGANDDAISLHTNDSNTATLRSGIIVADNRISESQGISAVGAKAISIHGNVLRRMMGYGINVVGSQYNTASPQGHTPIFGVSITDNTIEDVFLRPESSPRNTAQAYIYVDGGVKQPGTGNTVAPTLFGTGAGNLYVNAGTDGTVPSPGGRWITITGNRLIRTKPTSTSWAAWGDVDSTAGLFTGANNGGALYTGSVAESNLNTKGIAVTGALTDSLIFGNIIATTGTPISFPSSNVSNNDYAGLAIENNRFSDFSYAGISFPYTTANYQKVRIVGNAFDGDPRLVSANRGANGTWTAAGAPYGIDLGGSLSGAVIERNAFRNLDNPLNPASLGSLTAFLRDNVLVGVPAAVGFSTVNVGVGTVYAAGPEWAHLIEDGNPNSTTFGKLLSTTLLSSGAMPTSGTYVAGHVVRSTAAGFVGWLRLTTGSTHVPGTDWQPLIAVSGIGSGLVQSAGGTLSLSLPASIDVQAITHAGGVSGFTGLLYVYVGGSSAAYTNGGIPKLTFAAPSSGSQATAHVTGMHASSVQNYVGGSGYAVNDIISVTGGTYTTQASLKVTSVSSGAVTGFSVNNTGVAYTALPGGTNIATTTSGAGTGFTIQKMTFAYSGNTGAGDGIVIDSPGSGYSTPASAAITVTYDAGTSNNTFTLAPTVSSTLTVGAGGGQVAFDSTGATLGVAGASGTPVKTAGALIDASGVRTALTTSGYTVPANTSLVRFTQGSAVASATVTLPTALADGQPIQFVQQGAGAVTAFTFSPAVNGWTNGSALAAGPGVGLRIRWDATAAAWYREQ